MKSYSAFGQTKSNEENYQLVSDKLVGVFKNWFFVKFLFQLSTSMLVEPLNVVQRGRRFLGDCICS